MSFDKSEYLTAPIALKKPLTTSHHGIEKTDQYAWLRADNWQEVMQAPEKLDPEIREYLEAENAFTAATLADTEPLQKTLFEEMKGRIKEDDSTVPAPDGHYAYYAKYEIGGQHPIYCRQTLDGENETVLLDVNQLAEPHNYYNVGAVDHSNNHKYLAYTYDDKGSEFYTLRIKDLETGQHLIDEITEVSGAPVWSADDQTLFYAKLNENHRPQWIYRHKVGTTSDQDVIVYEESDPGFFASVDITHSRKFILIDTSTHETNETYLIDANQPELEPQLVRPREAEVQYSVEHHGGGGFYDRLIILTNLGGAEDFKIVETPLSAMDSSNWSIIEDHKPGRLIQGFSVFKEFLVRQEIEDGLPRIVIRSWIYAEEHSIEFKEEAYSLGLNGVYEYNTDTMRFSYSSMTTPAQIYDYNMDTQERTLRKTVEVPSGHNPDDYVTRRMLAPAHDGESVPVSLLYRKDAPRDGSAPVLLYGYGSYGMSMPASFSTGRLSLVDRGFIYAIAHIRGGKEKGFGWYKRGRRDQKINTFKDFISCGNYLVETGMTKRGNIVAHGGSAGGLLMGAVANMAPDLFRGIIAEVPFVDTLTTILDDTLPLTPIEWPEWGNPITDKQAYEWIAEYSPYDNVCRQDYPHILALAGLTDPRVTYWEPAKWVAKLRELKSDQNLLLLKTNMDAGHAGASGRFDRLKEVALSYAFALKVIEIE
ncbi:MAG: S9 family peptidase [Methyloligellaceae bacterium]